LKIKIDTTKFEKMLERIVLKISRIQKLEAL